MTFGSDNPWLALDFEPAFQALGDEYFDVVRAAQFPHHLLRFRNDAVLADRFGLEPEMVSDRHFIEAFGEFRDREPFLAMRYHGYQFGYYNARLGDGRGFLYGQVRGQGGQLWDLATKGSGTTPYSRGGDGRLTLKGGVREVLASEMLARLGVNTSRSLSLVETGEELWRGDEPSPTRSSVLVRTGQSHLRFGTFERLHYLKRADLIERLLEHTIAVYYPHLVAEPDRYGRFYGELVDRVALLAAQWMAAGFCHGVLNTDNMLVTGESFDYGPFAFIPTYDLDFTAAYFDHDGRYAYGNQPMIARLNLELLQKPLGLVIEPGDLAQGLNRFPRAYDAAYRGAMLSRLGWDRLAGSDGDDLVAATVQFLAESQVPYHDFFIALRQGYSPAWRDQPEAWSGDRPFWLAFLDDQPEAKERITSLGDLSATAHQAWQQWATTFDRLLQACSTEDLEHVGDRLRWFNPQVTLVRPVIETMWAAITEADDWQPFYDWLDDLWEAKSTARVALA